ncbi:unnamed protein product [Caenorhabditis auriculariae]|uniref:GIY-YIG domain-containing protein n=1 Tax=Caenorhabditis auriculariae TaxID=2777116 RepID=A0A8S1HTH2_9PELO|nr:unnamed protein product [Caenorhabditis auriculariae]
MVDVVTLSSDSEDELVDFKKTPKKLKRLSKGSKSSSPKKSINIEGVPKSFSSDSKTRFSFGVCGDDSFLDIPTTSKWNFSPNKSDKNEENIRESDSPDLFAKPPLDYKSPNKKISPKIDEFALTSSDDEKKDDLALRALISPNKKRTKRGEKKNLIQNEFFGVYCLISRSPRPCFKNRCYIGYTVDPNRRIMQHNGGREKGGAKKTDNRGPWDMVCVVHGFPNSVAALRFEWAWQNPNVSKVIRHHELKKGRKETPFAFQLRIACCLINSKPFSRFALTFRWLELVI